MFLTIWFSIDFRITCKLFINFNIRNLCLFNLNLSLYLSIGFLKNVQYCSRDSLLELFVSLSTVSIFFKQFFVYDFLQFLLQKSRIKYQLYWSISFQILQWVAMFSHILFFLFNLFNQQFLLMFFESIFSPKFQHFFSLFISGLLILIFFPINLIVLFPNFFMRFSSILKWNFLFLHFSL